VLAVFLVHRNSGVVVSGLHCYGSVCFDAPIFDHVGLQALCTPFHCHNLQLFVQPRAVQSNLLHSRCTCGTMHMRVNVLEPPDSRLALPDMPSMFDFRHGQVCSEDSVQLAVVLSAASAACKPGLHHAALQCCAVSWLPHDSFPLLTRSQWHCRSSFQVSLICISESMLMCPSQKLLTPWYEHKRSACTQLLLTEFMQLACI